MNTILFYGGIALCVVAVISAGIYFFISKKEKDSLNVQLEAEYGKRDGR